MGRNKHHKFVDKAKFQDIMLLPDFDKHPTKIDGGQPNRMTNRAYRRWKASTGRTSGQKTGRSFKRL